MWFALNFSKQRKFLGQQNKKKTLQELRGYTQLYHIRIIRATSGTYRQYLRQPLKHHD